MSTSDPDPTKPTRDPTAEGARARHQGRPRDACPYPLDSEKREEWMEGDDGRVQGAGPDLPMDPT
jgi:ribosome modulation factor